MAIKQTREQIRISKLPVDQQVEEFRKAKGIKPKPELLDVRPRPVEMQKIKELRTKAKEMEDWLLDASGAMAHEGNDDVADSFHHMSGQMSAALSIVKNIETGLASLSYLNRRKA